MNDGRNEPTQKILSYEDGKLLGLRKGTVHSKYTEENLTKNSFCKVFQ